MMNEIICPICGTENYLRPGLPHPVICSKCGHRLTTDFGQIAHPVLRVDPKRKTVPMPTANEWRHLFECIGSALRLHDNPIRMDIFGRHICEKARELFPLEDEHENE